MLPPYILAERRSSFTQPAPAYAPNRVSRAPKSARESEGASADKVVRLRLSVVAGSRSRAAPRAIASDCRSSTESCIYAHSFFHLRRVRLFLSLYPAVAGGVQRARARVLPSPRWRQRRAKLWPLIYTRAADNQRTTAFFYSRYLLPCLGCPPFAQTQRFHPLCSG